MKTNKEIIKQFKKEFTTIRFKGDNIEKQATDYFANFIQQILGQKDKEKMDIIDEISQSVMDCYIPGHNVFGGILDNLINKIRDIKEEQKKLINNKSNEN